MPTRRIDYVEQPFFRPRVTPDTSRLGLIYTGMGDTLARTSLYKGENLQRGLQTLGQLFSGYGETIRGQQAAQAAYALREREKAEERAYGAEQARLEREAKAAKDAAEVVEKEKDRKARTGEKLYEAMTGAAKDARLEKAQAAKDAESTRRYNQTENRLQKQFEENKALRLQLANKPADAEKPSVWVSKGNDMRFVAPTVAAQMSAEGWRSGNTREQGRPVVSGDAADLAAMDEALKLSEGMNFQPDETGILPSLGASAPDWVTNATGFGVGDKQRQGIINLSRQIIGKGLEGGVLRKEDEEKYKKILPTMSDHPDVVKSKVAEMIRAVQQKKNVRLDALEDAGYDVTKFRARSAAATVRMVAPNGQEQDVPADQVEHYKARGAKVKG